MKSLSLYYFQADIAGIPESFLPPNDGYSLVPTLKGKTQEQPKYVVRVCVGGRTSGKLGLLYTAVLPTI